MGITVEDVLKFGGLKGARVLAGHKGLVNEIKAVDVIEEPYITKWLRSNTLMLTTFYALKDNKEAQINLVRKMAEAGAAGLVVDPKTYIERLPEEVLKLANELNLPVIEIPPEVGYIDIITPILNAIFDRESHITKKAEEINELFTNVILKKGGFQGIANTLTELTGYPAVILDKSFGVLAWRGKENYCGKCLGEIIAGGQIEEILKTTGLEVSRTKTSIKSCTRYKNHDITFMVIPVKIDMEVHGYIMIWGIERPFDKLDLIAIEHASKVTAIELIKQEAIQENQRRQRKTFFSDLLKGHFSSNEEVYSRAANLGIDLKGIGAVIAAEMCYIDRDLNKSNIKLTYSNIIELICSKLSEIQDLILFENSKHIVILPKITGVEKTTGENIKKELLKIGFLIKTKLEEEIGFVAVALGIGRFYRNLSDIKKSYSEAQKALIIIRKVFNTAAVIHFDDLGVYKLLTKFDDGDELDLFFKETVYPLKKYDEENGTELIRTLDIYFECGENLASAADKLYIHINTLKYRMNRIKEILGISSFTMENKINLYMGLKIMKLFGNP